MADDDDQHDDDQHDDDDKDKGGSGKGSDNVPPAVKAALRKANKEAETYRLKLKELEDRDKSETDKLKDSLTVAEKRAADAEARALRLEVAAEKGLTMVQAKRLVGATREELEADAEELLESFGAAVNGSGGAKPPAGKPREKLRGARVPDADEPEPDVEKIADQVFRQSRGGS